MSSVLEIADFAAPYSGNFIASLRALAEGLRARGVGTVFLFPARAKTREWAKALSDAYTVLFLPERGSTAIFLRRICRRFDVCCVHTHFIDKSVYIPLRLACVGIPHVFHAHSLPKFREDDALLPLRRRLLHAREILCVSAPVAEAYRRRGYRGCTVVPNGVDFARLRSGDALPVRHPFILCFGYDFPIKGIDTVLTAFERYDRAHIYTLGICTADHYAQAERALRRRFGEVPAWVRLLPGREDVGAYYASADVFLSASRQEGMPYAVLEAAYCGLPLVLSDIAPHTSLDLPGAQLFSVEDAEALFRAVLTVKADARSEARRNSVQQRFSLEKWTLDVLPRLLPDEERIV